MFFSVVIPLYNKEAHVLRAVRSVLNQTHEDFELIIVDDGSTDFGPSVVASIRDSRVRLIRQPNGGVSRARNEGVRHAKAEWVAFLDADDEYLPDFLEVMARSLVNHAAQGTAFAGANYYINNRSQIAKNGMSGDGVFDYFTLFGNQCSPNSSSTTVVRRDKFLESGGFPEGVKQFEDWVAWIKLAFAGSFGYVAEPLGIYHDVAGGASRTRRPVAEFVHDAEWVPKVIRHGIKTSGCCESTAKLAWRCSNEFVVNVATRLAYYDEKRYALKFLAHLNLRHLGVADFWRSKRLVLQLGTPAIVKVAYRRLKAKASDQTNE